MDQRAKWLGVTSRIWSSDTFMSIVAPMLFALSAYLTYLLSVEIEKAPVKTFIMNDASYWMFYGVIGSAILGFVAHLYSNRYIAIEALRFAVLLCSLPYLVVYGVEATRSDAGEYVLIALIAINIPFLFTRFIEPLFD